MIKRIKLLGMFCVLLFLTGCDSDVPYNAELFKPSKENCWPCQMYMQAFNAMDKVLDACLDTICENSLTILKLGLLFWMLFRVARLFFSLSAPNIKKELFFLEPSNPKERGTPKGMVIVLFKAMIIVIFLNNPTYIYDFFGKAIIQPLGDGFLSMSSTVLEAPSKLGISFNYNTGIDWLDAILRSGMNVLQSSGESTVSASKMFGKLPMTVLSVIYQIYDALWSNIGLGFQLWSTREWSGLVAGTILIGGMLWLVIMMPLSFVDAFIRIGMVLILLPLLMVGWVFSYPKGIVGKLFHTLLGAFFDILFCCIYITFLISTFRVYEDQEMPYMFSASAQTTEGGMRVTAAQFGTDFLILIMLTWSMVKLSSKISDFSGYFFDHDAGNSMTGTINTIKGFVTKGIRIGVAALSGPAGWAKEAMGAAKNAVDPENSGKNEEGTSGEEGSSEDKKQTGEGDNKDSSKKEDAKKDSGSQKKAGKK